MIDNIEWLEQQRDSAAATRDAAYTTGDWKTGAEYNERVEQLYAAVCELRAARKRLAVFSEVLQCRILIAAKSSEQADRGIDQTDGGKDKDVEHKDHRERVVHAGDHLD